MEAENVTDYSRMLQEEMGTQIVVDHLHGKMEQAAKDEIMERFGRNEIQILVSTTVIEVGIDVPNATVMMIENAERSDWRSFISSAVVLDEENISLIVFL